MNKTGAVVAATILLTATTAGLARPALAQIPGESQEMIAPAPADNPPAAWTGNLPLFTIGQLPVQAWAPVEMPYDPNMNRNQAANPIWGSEMSDSQR